MRRLAIAMVLMGFACSNRDCKDNESTEQFSDQNLLLDRYMPEKCFRLVSCDDSDCVQTVYTFSEGDYFMTDEEWSWYHEPPNLFVVDEYEIDVYHPEEGGDCWELEAFALNLKTEACPCPWAPVYDRTAR